MRRLEATLLLLVAVTASPLRAQSSSTAELLQRAKSLYENLEVERALMLLRQIISPQSPFEVTRDQRVEAYKYLGAALALQQGEAKRDSAVLYFRAAIDRDPFIDLDPRSFSPAQLQAFNDARSRTFAVGLKPVVGDTFDPRVRRLTFRGLSSHRAGLRVEVRAAGVARRVLFNGESDGLREVQWDGLLDDGRLVPPGRYELIAIGQSRLISVGDTARVFFEVAHDHPPLEDTLATLGPQDLLPEQHPAGAATADLLKGVGVAASALLIQTALVSGDLGTGNNGLSGAVAGAGTVTGIAAFFYRRSHRDIPENIAENARRRAERAQRNAAIQQRNAAILAQTRLIITPAAGQ